MAKPLFMAVPIVVPVTMMLMQPMMTVAAHILRVPVIATQILLGITVIAMVM